MNTTTSSYLKIGDKIITFYHNANIIRNFEILEVKRVTKTLAELSDGTLLKNADDGKWGRSNRNINYKVFGLTTTRFEDKSEYCSHFHYFPYSQELDVAYHAEVERLKVRSEAIAFAEAIGKNAKAIPDGLAELLKDTIKRYNHCYNTHYLETFM